MKRIDILRDIMTLYPRYLTRFPSARMSEILWARYQVASMEMLNDDQCMDLLNLFKEFT